MRIMKKKNYIKPETNSVAIQAQTFFATSLTKFELKHGENGAFPPTRDGCIHSLSMRKRG